MNIETAISIMSVGIGLTGLTMALICRKKQRGLLELLEFITKQSEDLEQTFVETSRADRLKASEQARRIAWLETRIRQPRLFKEEMIEKEVFAPEKTTSEPSRLNINERRHRVLALASRGQNAETIASTLGVMTGEVELILNLNRGAVSPV